MCACVLKFTKDPVFQKYSCGFRLSLFLIWVIPDKHNLYDLCWIYKSWIKCVDNCVQCDPWRSPFLAFWRTLSVLDYGYINNILKKRNTCALIEQFTLFYFILNHWVENNTECLFPTCRGIFVIPWVVLDWVRQPKKDSGLSLYLTKGIYEYGQTQASAYANRNLSPLTPGMDNPVPGSPRFLPLPKCCLRVMTALCPFYL